MRKGEQTRQDIIRKAAPIFNHAGAYVGAVAIGGSIQYLPAPPPQDQIRAVTQTAQRISRKLGWNAR